MDEKIYINGKLVPRKKAFISISDHGFLYGYGLFQTMRAYNGKIFLLDRHVKRLRDAAKIIGLESKLKDIDFEKICNETLTANKLKEARVRLTMTNGEGMALPWVDKGGKPTVVITVVPYTPFPEKKYNEGFKVGISSVIRCKQSVFSTMKSINYLLNVVARMEAAVNGLDETILLNDGGYIAEGGSGNVFFVEGGRLLTPGADSGIIPGVTREVILEMAASMGVSVMEGDISLDVIKKSEEIFMTNAIIEVMPVTGVKDDKGRMSVVGNGKPGKVTRRLMEAYRERVRREMGV
ncbi:MAG: aminotransferase class IV [Dehalococcoidales bacterium]